MHVRQYMTGSQFLKSVMSNYYCSVLYLSSVWLPNCKAIYKTKPMALHYRLLWTAFKDYCSKISQDDLSRRCSKANPYEWTIYTTTTIDQWIYPSSLKKVIFQVQFAGCHKKMYEFIFFAFALDFWNIGIIWILTLSLNFFIHWQCLQAFFHNFCIFPQKLLYGRFEIVTYFEPWIN